jgi:hypothetical protein
LTVPESGASVPVEQADEGGLAAAVRADDADAIAAHDADRYVPHDRPLAERFGNLLRLDD